MADEFAAASRTVPEPPEPDEAGPTKLPNSAATSSVRSTDRGYTAHQIPMVLHGLSLLMALLCDPNVRLASRIGRNLR